MNNVQYAFEYINPIAALALQLPNDRRSVMVVFDNLARILREILSQSLIAVDLKEWKLLGQEIKGQLMVGWVEEPLSREKREVLQCIGLYHPKTNKFEVLCKLSTTLNIIQASVNNDHSLLSFSVKKKCEEKFDGAEFYTHYIALVKKDENEKNVIQNITNLESLDLESKQQIMTNFLGVTTKDVSKLLVLIHLESITLYKLLKKASEKIITVQIDFVTKSFVWAQWDCDIQSLYFIHFRKTFLSGEGDDFAKQEASSTLSCLQFHEDLPHETVLNIPLNLPSIPNSSAASCRIYEDDPLPLRVHDCSLDLVVMSNSSGTICICHHYLYQPVKEGVSKSPKSESTVHFAYSVTLLHHGCVIHSVMPGVPWSLAKTMKPVFAFLGEQYLVVYAAELFTHLIDMGLAHEPYCHILMNGILTMVPQSASRLVPIKGEFTESTLYEDDTELLPTIMIDLNTMDLIEFEVVIDDLMSCLAKVESLHNRLSILHYLLVHASDFDRIEEALIILLKNPSHMSVPKFFKEVLIGGAFCLIQKNILPEANSLLNLLPMTSIEQTRQTETKLSQISCTTTQEILWNTAMMLLSPQQRLIPFVTDIWKKLWDQLIKLVECPRFKPSQAADKLLMSLGCYQPEALSTCNTPMSPRASILSNLFPLNISSDNEVSKAYAAKSDIFLPFLEIESCTASKQEHIISVSLREVTLHLLKNCLREHLVHVNPVANLYVSAQLEISKLLCHTLAKISGVEDVTSEIGFPLIKKINRKQRLLLFTYYQRYYNAVDSLAYPLPQGFTSFFCYLGFHSLSFQFFMMYLQNNVFELQIDVMKEIMQDIEDTNEGVNMKLQLLLLLPRSRSKRLLYNWPHGMSLMIRAREHAFNILMGVQNTSGHGLSLPKQNPGNFRGLASFPSADKLSPLDTFLDLLTAKASLTDLDFNLLIDATISSTQNLLQKGNN